MTEPFQQPANPTGGNRSIALALGVAVLVALGVRLLYFTEISSNPWFDHTLTDERIYDGIARRIVAGEAGWKDAFYQPPGYSLFLSLLYTLLGGSLSAVRFAQLMLGIANVALLYDIGLRVFGRRVAFVSALLLAVYAPMFFFEGMLLPAVLVVLLNLAFFAMLLRCLERPHWLRALSAGVLLGASAATMSIVLPFAAVAAVLGARHLLARPPGCMAGNRRMLLSVGTAFVLGVSLVVASCTLHNWVMARKLIVISDNLGINLYLGTGRHFEEKASIRPGPKWAELTTAPIRAGRGADASGYFVERSLQIIRSDPWGYAQSLARKLFLFAHGHELKRNQEIYAFRSYSSLLSGLLWKAGLAWPYGVLFPFSVLGMIHAVGRNNTGSRLLLLFCISHVLLLLPFFMAARYRMNVIPFLMLFAVYGGGVVLGALRDGQWRRLSACAMVLAVFLTLSNWRVGGMRRHLDADQYRTLASDYRAEGRLPEAQRMLRQASRLTPPIAPGNAIPQRTSTLLLCAGLFALSGYRKLAA